MGNEWLLDLRRPIYTMLADCKVEIAKPRASQLSLGSSTDSLKFKPRGLALCLSRAQITKLIRISE